MSAGKELPAGGREPRRGRTGAPAPWPRDCFFGGPLSQKAEETPCRREISGSSERQIGYQLRMYQTSISTCGFLMETQCQGQAPGGTPPTLWRKAVWSPIPGASQVKIKETSLCQTIELCFKNTSINRLHAALGGKLRNSLTGLNVKT